MAVLGSRPSKFKGDSLPVESVSWNDAKRFLADLNEKLGLGHDAGFRLPTEAEWEYAARASSTANYSFSDSAKDLGQHAWFDKNAKGTTHPVGGLQPNPWGLYDMYGNVSEWCEDAWHDTYENAPSDGTAWRGEDSDRVCRGGSWDHPSIELRSYYRSAEDPTETDKTLGFRVVLPLKSVWNLPPKTRP
jgi:formylglycine-generating enzyme required for sulfatase activity